MREKLRIFRQRLRCRLTAVVLSQASGLSTRVNLGPAAYARTNASWTRSSASPALPTMP